MISTEEKVKRWIYYSKPNDGFENWSQYAYGYKQALNIIIEKFSTTESPINYKDLVFPIFFLFRHLTELLLKEILIDYHKFINKDFPIPDTHDLNTLWKQVKPIIIELFFDESAGYLLKKRTNFTKLDIQKLNSIINKLHNLDRNSFSFRYPVDKKGKQAINVNIEEQIDQLKVNVQETHSSLSFVSFMIFHLKHGIFTNSA